MFTYLEPHRVQPGGIGVVINSAQLKHGHARLGRGWTSQILLAHEPRGMQHGLLCLQKWPKELPKFASGILEVYDTTAMLGTWDQGIGDY